MKQSNQMNQMVWNPKQRRSSRFLAWCLVFAMILTTVNFSEYRMLVRAEGEPAASGSGVSGNGVSGNGVSGNGVSGDGVSGNGVSGNGVSGEGVSGNGTSGEAISISGDGIKVQYETIIYNMDNQFPELTVTDGEKTLVVNKDYTVSGEAKKDVGSYSLTIEGRGEYTGTKTVEWLIDQRRVIPVLSYDGPQITKIYDKTTKVSGNADIKILLADSETKKVLSGDAVEVKASFYVYDDDDAGEKVSISACGITISGDAKDNYLLCHESATAVGIGTILPKEVKPSVCGTVTKKYDTTKDVPKEHSLGITLDGVVDFDTVTANAKYEYISEQVGNPVGIEASGIELSGEAAANYYIEDANKTIQNKDIGIITKKNGNISGDAYKTEYTYGDKIDDPADYFTCDDKNVKLHYRWLDDTGAEMADSPKNAGEYMLDVSAVDDNNYDIPSKQVKVTIKQKTITPSIEGMAEKVYDKTTAVSEDAGLSIKLNGVVSGDAVTAEAAAYEYSQAAVGDSIAITASGITISGDAAGNYALSGDAVTKEGAGKIVKKEVMPSIKGTVTKVYDGTTNVPKDAGLSIELDGVLEADKTTVSATASYSYSTKETGEKLRVDAAGIKLNANGEKNYKLKMDKASANVGTITKAVSSYTAPAGLTAHCGQKLADVKLPEGFGWQDAADTVLALGETKAKVTYTPADANNYNVVKDIEVAVSVTHDMTEIKAAEPTKEAVGNSAYWHCSGCDKYFGDVDAKNEIARDSWILPYVQDAITVQLGKKVTLDKIMLNGASTFEKLTLADESKYKKYLTVDGEKGTIATKKYYKQKIKKSIPVTVTAGGRDYTVNVKIVIPAPKVKISRTAVTIGGIEGYRYTFKYNVAGASGLKVKAMSGYLKTKNMKAVNKTCASLFTKKNKGEFKINIKKSSLKKKKIKFKISAVYGKNESEAVTIEK